jgi:hypothetical protein
MVSTEREEFGVLFRRLCFAFDRAHSAEREDAYWLGLSKMSMLDFARVVECCLGEKAPERFPTVRALWELSRSLKPVRAQGPSARGMFDVDSDPWGRVANEHLLRHLRTVAKNQPRRYGNSQYAGHIGVRAGPEMQERIAQLILAKNLWATEMREVPDSRRPEVQEQLWREFIASAEAQIDLLIARRALPDHTTEK